MCSSDLLVAEARERGVGLRRVEGRLRASTTADWTLTELDVDLAVQLDPRPAAADGADASSSPPSGEAALIEAMRERLLGCPVLRNLDPAINRSLRIAITP